MATVNMTGFETGDTIEAVSATGTLSVQSATTRTGGYALRVNPTTTATGQYLLRGLAATGVAATQSIATSFLRFYFRYATRPTSGDEVIVLVRDADTGDKGELRLNSSGNLAVYSSTPTLLATGTVVLNANQWYRIEWRVPTGSALIEVLVDGTADISLTGTLSGVNTGQFQLGKVINRNNNTVDFFYDDVVWSDSAYPGAGQIDVMQPSGAGNYTAWTGAYTDVDEIPHDSDTTYITTSTSGAAFTAALEDAAAAGISGTVNVVKGLAVVRDEGGAGNIQIRLRSGSTDNDTTNNDPGSTYVARAKIYDTDPADSAAWTLGDLDGVEMGVEANSAIAFRCTLLCAMVDYVPPPPPTTSWGRHVRKHSVRMQGAGRIPGV